MHPRAINRLGKGRSAINSIPVARVKVATTEYDPVRDRSPVMRSSLRWNDGHSTLSVCLYVPSFITATDNAQSMRENVESSHTMALHNININIVETTWMQNKSKLRCYSFFREDLSRRYDLCDRIIWKKKIRISAMIYSYNYISHLCISIFRILFPVSRPCCVWAFRDIK